MSNTELVPVALPQSAILPTPVKDPERTDQQPQDEEGDPWNVRRRAEQELAPVDGGTAAWRLLLAAFMFEALLWGGYIHVARRTEQRLITIKHRLSPLLWCLPRILLQDSRVFRQSLHFRCGHHSIRSRISWSTSHHAFYPALPALATTDDLGRLYVP